MSASDYRKRLEAIEAFGQGYGNAVLVVYGHEPVGQFYEDLRSLLSEAERLRDRDEEVREELADAWPEDREAVLAGDPVSLIAKLIRERDEEIAEHEAERSKSERLRSLVEEAGKVVEPLGDAEPWPASPYPVGTDGNCRTAGWNAFFQGKSRDRSPFPPIRRDLLTGYQEGWDAARSLSTKLKAEGQ